MELYKEQREIVYSVRDSVETYAVAGNKLGKDFVTGFICLGAMLAPRTFLGTPSASNEVRIVTTSVKGDHLRVLWGEIMRFVQTARYPLTADKGGPLVVNHWDIRKVVKGQVCPISYLRGMVSEKGEGLAGHHAAHTLCVTDEASGVDNVVYSMQQGWAKRFLAIGNPNPCPPGHYFFDAVAKGDLLAS